MRFDQALLQRLERVEAVHVERTLAHFGEILRFIWAGLAVRQDMAKVVLEKLDLGVPQQAIAVAIEEAEQLAHLPLRQKGRGGQPWRVGLW
jgi:hypothetical protein